MHILPYLRSFSVRLAKFCALCAKRVSTKCTVIGGGLFCAFCANRIESNFFQVQTSLPQSRNFFMFFWHTRFAQSAQYLFADAGIIIESLALANNLK